jgi:hypothetical protein
LSSRRSESSAFPGELFRSASKKLLFPELYCAVYASADVDARFLDGGAVCLGDALEELGG